MFDDWVAVMGLSVQNLIITLHAHQLKIALSLRQSRTFSKFIFNVNIYNDIYNLCFL